MILSFQNEIKNLNLKQSNEINELKKSNDSLIKKLKENEEEAKKKEENKGIDCSFKNDQLCGIISYLKKKYGDDLEKKGVLNLSDAKTSSRYPMERLFMYDPDHINDEYQNQWYGVTHQSDGWFEIDFKEKKINLTSYTIRSSIYGPNRYCKPKSWRIAGSNDRTHWDVLNHQIDNSSLNGRYLQNHFTCENNHNYYRYIRYIQEDSWNKEFIYNICITCIELFGYIEIE